MKITTLAIIVLLFISCDNKKDANEIPNEKTMKLSSEELSNTKQIFEIQQHELDNLIDNFLNKIEDGEDFSVDDDAAAVRIANTIAFNKLFNMEDKYTKFWKVYVKDLSPKARQALGAVKKEDGSWYSESMDIYIGKLDEENSRFNIIDLKDYSNMKK